MTVLTFCLQAGTGHLSLMIKLESDVKRLKCDLQLSRNRENELRDQIVCYMSRLLRLSSLIICTPELYPCMYVYVSFPASVRSSLRYHRYWWKNRDLSLASIL